MNCILDTNVISEVVSARPNPEVIGWMDSVDPERVFLSVIAIGELKKRIEKLADSNRKLKLIEWLHDDLLVRFENQLLPIDQETMLVWGSLVARLEATGHPISAIDSLLAATALRFQYALVTRNVAHFEHTGVILLNPWA